MEILYGTPPPLYAMTLGLTAWAALQPYLAPHVWQQVADMVRQQQPDKQGRITLQLGEHMYTLVAGAVDDAQFDHIEGEN